MGYFLLKRSKINANIVNILETAIPVHSVAPHSDGNLPNNINVIIVVMLNDTTKTMAMIDNFSLKDIVKIYGEH